MVSLKTGTVIVMKQCFFLENQKFSNYSCEKIMRYFELERIIRSKIIAIFFTFCLYMIKKYEDIPNNMRYHGDET